MYCEGGSTEPTYFRALGNLYKDALVEIELIGAVGVPLTVANAAVDRFVSRSKQKLESFEKADEVWAIFDRDDHPKFDEAVAICKKTGVRVARSNPCFEVWLILHIEDYHKPDGRKAVQDRLKALHPEYDPKKKKTCDCAKLLATIEAAESRAANQVKRRSEEGKPHGAPSTTVHELTTGFRAAAVASKPKPK